ncbi:pilus assembly protein [Sphingomonas sp. HDW15A]|uniref:TadE/TadG family type IV pilus assembly protein n=1 Tax=Sphingomonas sp. HDW15A TaxID=2714942 RepID=UPI00140A1A6A|nr:TadE/TadG family type IV pilus assembly protein [Sphingomonas sp. HDW15A]QIK95674.1 pilus assembly protein [Sphingomonas sp. HDW15A]
MMGLSKMLRDRGGSAAVEMVMVTPLLLTIMFGATELGRYFWSEHQLIKAVRDASIWASRQTIDNFNCATSTVSTTVTNATRNLVKTGVASGGTNRLPNWSNAGASITLSLNCVTAAGGTTLAGIYTANAGKVPVLTITATLPYNSIMHGFGLNRTFTMQASQQTAVMGV